ncbi:MAG: response regulator [Pleurocapsa sp. MO_226.B13]|nr:response regulator [Pleurocapsa sp. MO_226.B13]
MTKILVIEDELFVRENIVDLLEAEDFEVFSTENGILGILWARENLPDLVICDVMMPEMSGHDVLAEMRELPETSLTPFIFLTAMADKDDIRHGMELGADDYLTKPFTRDELLNAIDSRLLKQAKLMKQYHDEHQRTKVLEQKIKELEQLQIKDKLSQEYQQALLKISTAVNLIGKIQSGQNRSLTEQNLQMIRETCAAEIALLKQLPDLEAQIRAKNKVFSSILQNYQP